MKRRGFLAALAAVVAVWKAPTTTKYRYKDEKGKFYKELEKAYHDVMCGGPGKPEVIWDTDVDQYYVWNRTLTDEELRYLSRDGR